MIISTETLSWSGVPGVVVGDAGERRVTDARFAGELRLGQRRHADDVGAPRAVQLRLGARRERRALDHDERAAAMRLHAGVGRRRRTATPLSARAERRVEARCARRCRGRRTSTAGPCVRSMSWSGTTMCSGAISSRRLPTALTDDDVLDAERRQRPDVRALRDLRRQDAMPDAVPRQERHARAAERAQHDRVGRRAERRVDRRRARRRRGRRSRRSRSRRSRPSSRLRRHRATASRAQRARDRVARTAARSTPRSVTIAVMRCAGVTSNAGLRAGDASGRDPRAARTTALRPRRALRSRSRRRSRVARIDRADGRDDVERHAVRLRRQREPVGADLVRRVAVRRDAVGADDHGLHLAARDQARRRAIGDDLVRDALLLPAPTPSGARPAAAAASRRPARGCASPAGAPS